MKEDRFLWQPGNLAFDEEIEQSFKPQVNFHIIPVYGGHGSGNFGHSGRAGAVGGSGSGGGGSVSGKELSSKDLVEKVWPVANERMDQYKQNPVGSLSGQDVILKSIQEEQGYNGLPKVVDKEILDGMINRGEVIEMYRGVSSSDQVEQFKSGELFAGQGGYGNGTYTAYGKEGFETARFYSGTSPREDGILRMGLRSDAKIIDYPVLKEMISKGVGLSEDRQVGQIGKIGKGLYTIVDTPGVSGDRRLGAGVLHSSLMEPGRAAAILGYDAIRATHDFMVVLNRTKLVVQK
jgi:hypothetical protein